MSDTHTILLGTSEHYIHTVHFSPTEKTLKHIHQQRISENPTWITAHPTIKNIVYANANVQGKVYCIQVDDQGKLTILDEAQSGATGPNHMAVFADHGALLIAHYGNQDACLASVPLDPTTGRFETSAAIATDSFVPEYTPSSHPRLEQPHVHHVLIHQDEVISCDLGNNKIWRLVSDLEKGGWRVKGVIEDFEEGDGPRHATIHPNGRYIYVLNEVSSTLTVHTLPSSGPSELIYRHTTLPAHDASNGKMIASEILLLPPLTSEGDSLLILTNRESTDSKGDALALFTVSSDGSTIKPASEPFYHGVGRYIRGMGADPSGRWIVAAGRDEGGVVILERIGDGTKLQEVVRVDIPNVIAPLWL